MRYWLAFLLVVGMVGPCWGQSAAVSFADGRPPETIAILERDGKAYVSVSDVARLLSLEKAVDWDLQRVTLTDPAHAMEILIGGTVWVSDGQTIAAGETSLCEGREICLTITECPETELATSLLLKPPLS